MESEKYKNSAVVFRLLAWGSLICAASFGYKWALVVLMILFVIYSEGNSYLIDLNYFMYRKNWQDQSAINQSFFESLKGLQGKEVDKLLLEIKKIIDKQKKFIETEED